MTVEDWRSKIDEIDRRLVELLNERSRCVVEIGRIKQRRERRSTSRTERRKCSMASQTRIPARFQTPQFAACSSGSWMRRDRWSAP